LREAHHLDPTAKQGEPMSIAYLAQPEQQQQLEWLDGGTLVAAA